MVTCVIIQSSLIFYRLFKLKHYLFRWVIIYDYWWLFICADDYLSLFVIINVFDVKGVFCNYF